MIPVAWDVRDDQEEYWAAHRLQSHHRGRWLVMWGPGSRAFFAFYRGRAHVAPLSAPTERELHHRILRTEATLAAAAATDCSCPDPKCIGTLGPPARRYFPRTPT